MKKLQIIIDVEIDQPFANAEQERYVLATIEDALDTHVWFDLLANEAVAPQKFSDARARIAERIRS
jgi:hypothetical protein